jgi:tetratricopeptide (TPR) repeat protein
MKFVAWMLLSLMILPAFGQDAKSTPSQEITTAGKTSLFSKAARLFGEGKYESTVEELNAIESRTNNKSQQGLIMYWKGICYNRLQNFPEAIASFDKALTLEYSPEDLNYEYGQALFASEKLQEARLQFRESLKRRFKRGVSLYYIAYISNELGDKKKAVTFYKAIDKLGEEGKDVQQAAQVQIGDIYLEQVEKTRDAFKSVETYVIPQYKYALSLNEESPISGRIREKITELQRKYDLVLFKLRNGRPVLNPPYFLRAAAEVGMDTNVTFAPTETTISKSKQSSGYGKVDVIGRYTFYHRNYLSISPEFRYNRTYYFKRVPEIYRNDNYLIAPAIRTAYEHSIWKKPASVLFDYDYAEARRDVNAKKELQFSSRAHTLMLGERFNFFSSGESILRIRQRIFDSYQNTADSKTTSFVFEQVKAMETSTLLFYFSFDRTKVKSSIFDNNSMTLRTDYIMPRLGNWFTPSAGLGLTTIDPYNNRSTRGREFLINPNVRLSRVIGKRWRGSLKYDYQNYQSKDKTNFAYKKSVYSFELEYLF